jgi:CHAT domain-containing protein/tetratricopeptide (TPR) repeat protein
VRGRGGLSGRAIRAWTLPAALLAGGLAGCGAGPAEETVGATTADAGTPTAGQISGSGAGSAPAAAPPEPRRIPIQVAYGEPTELTLAGGECHVLELELEADRFVRVEVEQLGLDVATELVASGDGEPLIFDSPVGPSRPEVASFVSADGGVHRLEVCSWDGPSAAGSYRLLLESPRAPTRRDRAFADGLRFYAQASRAAEPAETHEGFTRALERFREAGARAQEGWALYKLGRLAKDQGDLKAAEAYFRQSAQVHAELEDLRQEAFALTFLGPVLNKQDRLVEALEVNRRSLQAAEEADDAGLILSALGNLGNSAQEVGYSLTALDLQRRRETLARSLDDRRAQHEALTQIGKIHLYSGQWEEAIPLFEGALAVAREHRLQTEATESLEDLGRAYLDGEEPERALALFEQALDDHRRGSRRLAVARTLNNLGRCYRRLGESGKARAAFDEALSIAVEVGTNPKLTSFIYLNLASLHFDGGDFRAAIEPCERAFSILREYESPGFATGGLRCLARTYRALGQLDRSIDHVRDAVEIFETFRSRNAVAKLRADSLADYHPYYELHADLLVRLEARQPGSGHAARAFEAAERSKARTFLDGLAQAEAEVLRWADPRLLEREAVLQSKMSDAERDLLHARLQDEPPARTRLLDRRLRALRDEHALLMGQVLADSPDWSALLTAGPATLEEIRAELLADGKTQLVSFFVGEEGSYAWVVGPDSVHVEPLPAAARIEGLARRAADLLARSEQPHLRLQAELTVERLAQEVWHPLIPHLTARRIVLAKDGALHLVPFAAFPLPAESGSSEQPLTVDRFELVEVPSASAAVVLLRRHVDRPDPPRMVAVVADPVFERADERFRSGTLARTAGPSKTVAPAAAGSPDTMKRGSLGPLERLTGSAEEARFLETLVPDLHVATDFAASRDLLLSGELRDFRVLHFSGHGLGEDGLSGILLSVFDRSGREVDGLVQPYEIQGLGLSAELVVLSACRTAVGEEVQGEGLLGTSRAFLLSGASQVLASLWDVDDEATAELMKRFHEAYLREGLPPAQALQEAQRSMRSSSRWRAPHYWAGFVLQGAGS